MKFRGIPLTIRAGRQQIVWGETDNFRMLDRANSLDLTWHFAAGDPGAGLRLGRDPPPVLDAQVPLRPGRRLEVLAELPRVVLEPGRLVPGQAGVPAAALGPAASSTRSPTRSTAPSSTAPCAPSHVKVTAGRATASARAPGCMNDTKLFEQGDYDRNPIDNSQVGVRYHGIAPFGLEFTLNYFYQRWARRRRHELRAAPRALPNEPTRTAQLARQQADHRRASSRPSSYTPVRPHASACRPTTPTRRSRRRCSASRRSTTSASRSSTSRKETVIDTPRAARRHQEEHVEGHDRLRPADVDPVAQQEEHGVPHRAVLLALPARTTRAATAQDVAQPRRRQRQRDRRRLRAWSAASTCRRRVRTASQRCRLPRQDPRLGDALHARRLHVLPRRQHRAGRSASRSTR